MMSIIQNELYKKMFNEVRRDREWFLKNYQELVGKSPEEFVAIWKEKVIADASDIGRLKSKISLNLKEEKSLINI